MTVRAIKTEPKCKLCQHPKRAEIDGWIERRSNHEIDDSGNRINGEYVLRELKELGVVNPTIENVALHFRKHCEKVDSGTAAALEIAATEAASTVLAILRGDTEKRDLDTDLDVLWAIGIAEIEARVARGERTGITPDLMMKIAAEKNRRAHNETQADLLGALVGGIGHALSGQARQLETGRFEKADIITDAEYAEIGADSPSE